jgi:hypothetical protein
MHQTATIRVPLAHVSQEFLDLIADNSDLSEQATILFARRSYEAGADVVLEVQTVRMPREAAQEFYRLSVSGQRTRRKRQRIKAA